MRLGCSRHYPAILILKAMLPAIRLIKTLSPDLSAQCKDLISTLPTETATEPVFRNSTRKNRSRDFVPMPSLAHAPIPARSSSHERTHPGRCRTGRPLGLEHRARRGLVHATTCVWDCHNSKARFHLPSFKAWIENASAGKSALNRLQTNQDIVAWILISYAVAENIADLNS